MDPLKATTGRIIRSARLDGGKFSEQPMGKNTLAQIGKQFAVILNKAKPKTYTGTALILY